MMYFAYGSNMDPAQMDNLVCRDYRFVSVAELRGYRLDFTRHSSKWGGGVADIVPDPEASVWGVLYDLGQDCLEPLDRKEGVHIDMYRRVTVAARPKGRRRRVEALSYTVQDKQSHIPPPDGYLDTILRGAEHWGLPDRYVRRLRRLHRATPVGVASHG